VTLTLAQLQLITRVVQPTNYKMVSFSFGSKYEYAKFNFEYATERPIYNFFPSSTVHKLLSNVNSTYFCQRQPIPHIDIAITYSQHSSVILTRNKMQVWKCWLQFLTAKNEDNSKHLIQTLALTVKWLNAISNYVINSYYRTNLFQSQS